MNDDAGIDVLAEVLRERMESVKYIIDEWSVPGADAVNYAQIKDLIWQIAAPLGISLLGFSLAEDALQNDPGDISLEEAQALFGRVGEEMGSRLEQFLDLATLLGG
jgi:hypothetical protein